MSDPNLTSTYRDGLVYQARVTDQRLSEGGSGMRLVLTVKILARLKDPANLAGGTEPCPQQEREVWVNLPRDNRERLLMALRDLGRLGFTGDDLSVLHPDHPERFPLAGRDVHVRCRLANDAEYWNLAWPARTLRLDECRSAAGAMTAAVAAARQATRAPLARAAGSAREEVADVA